jgi:cytochrome P450
MPKLTGFPAVALPGPRPAPLLGALPNLLRFVDDPIGALRRMRPYGDVVGVVRDSPALVCVFGPERNRDVLSNTRLFRNDEEFLPWPPESPLARMQRGMVAINGDLHKRHRRLMQPAFSRSALRAYAGEVVRVTEGVVARWPKGQVADLDKLTRDLALCVAVQCFFGLDVLAGVVELGELAAAYVERVVSPLTMALPYDVPGLPYRKTARLGARMLEGLGAVIARKREEAAPGKDVLSLLLRAHDDDGTGFREDELISEAATLFVAGHETMAKTLMWALFVLERHPAALADVLDEVDGALGGRTITAEDIPKMPLMDRVIKETMRVFPAVPITFPRVPAEDTDLGGRRLPKGANIIVSPFATHHDPALYPEPERFRPERWETIKPSTYEYLPFGAGPRTCVGAAFAQQALRLMLPTILQHARVSVAPYQDVSRRTRANILRARHGLKVRVQGAHRRRVEPAPIRGDIGEIVTLA